jgi:hypothetical protein
METNSYTVELANKIARKYGPSTTVRVASPDSILIMYRGGSSEYLTIEEAQRLYEERGCRLG